MESLGLDRAFWCGRRVFLTGHTGFKGAWLSECLLALGAQVTGYALDPPTTPALFNVLRLDERLAHRRGNVGDLQRLTNTLEAAGAEVVFHLAAQPLVRYGYVDPTETYATNVMGTVHLLEASRRVPGVQAVVVITTDKCYENREWLWGYRENEALGGYDPYSSSKACAEMVTSAYRRSFFSVANQTRVASARAGNVIGGGDWATDRLIPDVMRAFAAGQSVAARYPDAIRPWQHVLEPLRGYLMLAQKLAGPDGPDYAEAWNFGPQECDTVAVRTVLDRLCALWPDAPGWRPDPQEQPHEAGYLKLDCIKAHTRLDWRPALTLDQALRLTVDWYTAAHQEMDMIEFTQRQIASVISPSDSSRVRA